MPAKVIWVTSPSGTGRNGYLARWQEECVQRGKKVKVYPIGQMLFEWAKKNGVHLTREKILKSASYVLDAVRGGVFEHILGRLKSEIKSLDAIVLSAHSFFYSDEVFLPAINHFYLQQFNPDMFVTFINGSDDILKKLNEREQWKDQNLTERDILHWQNIEVEVTGVLANIFDKDFFVIPTKQPAKTLYYLIFEPEREPIYFQVPISHLKKSEFEKVHPFVEKLWDMFTVFNPLTIETGKVEIGEEVDLAVHHQTVHRDLRWLLRQSKKGIAFIPKLVPTPGVFDEMKEAVETNKDAWAVFSKDTALSPFLVHFSSKIFKTEEDFWKFVYTVYIPSRMKHYTMENTIKRKCPDGSVGVIFKNNEEGKILILERKTEPLGWAPVAGHLDGKSPKEQAALEALEEVGLKVKKLNLLLGPVEIMNPCRRPKDSQIKYNCHDWFVYEAIEWEGEPKSGEPEKIGEIKWFSSSEIAGLSAKGGLDPAWKILFPMLGIQI